MMMPTPIHVLILEDRAADAELMLHELRKAGFDPDWQRVETEPEYMVALETNPDIILADWSLPQFSGLRALQLMNERSLDIPFIIVSGIIGEEAAIEAMQQGANDYLLKDRLTRLGPAMQHALEARQMRVQRRRAEVALRASEQKFRSFVEQSEDAAVLTDERGAIIEWNRGAERIFGQKRVDMVGQFLWEVQFQGVPPERKTPQTYESLKTSLLEGLKTGHAVWLNQLQEVVTQRSDGINLTIQTMAFPIPTEDGFMLGSISRDITERIRTEEELLKSEAKFRAIFDAASTAIFIVDLKAQKFFMCNNMCTKILGYSHEEFLHLDIADIHPVENMPFINEQIRKYTRGEEGIRSDINFIRKNGTVFPADLNPSLITIADRENLLISFIDVTERKRREEEIHSRNEELSALYQLSRLLADASDLENVIELINRHAVESVHTTFACLALLEDSDLVMRAFYPVRVLDHEFIIGNRQPLSALHVCQRVLDQNEPVILQDGSPEVGSLERSTLQLDFARSVCLVPLRVGDPSQDLNQALGLLILGETREEKREPFTPEKIRLAHSIGDQAAVAIRRLLLREQAGHRLQQLASLSEIDRTIASSFDLRVNLKMILQQIIEQLEVDAVDVLVLNHHLQVLEFAAGSGFQAPAMEHKRLRVGEGQAGQAALERQIIQIPDVAASGAVFTKPELLEAENVAAYFAVPLITKGQVKGVLEICNRTTLKPNEEWLDFLNTLAGQAAIAIDTVQMFDSLQRSTDELELAYDATIEGWSRAMDLRDKETEGHTLRVTEMTLKLARTFSLSETELLQVRRGALLHDIGKMGVPDGILLKPGPLTDEEWVVMKKHPTFAYEMLSPIHYLHAALDIPYYHHEWWDGTGYPRGLKGELIPLAARIFAVVDVYDALISERPYRKAWLKGKVLDHINAESGKHFDPQVVKAFMEMEEVSDN